MLFILWHHRFIIRVVITRIQVDKKVNSESLYEYSYPLLIIV